MKIDRTGKNYIPQKNWERLLDTEHPYATTTHRKKKVTRCRCKCHKRKK